MKKGWACFALFVASNSYADIEISGVAGLEQRYFLQDALYENQERSYSSAFLMPELYSEWNDGTDTLVVKPFYRIDQHDNERTHGDIREFQWAHYADSWETRVGIGKVFWGQTESLHLVDIINQTDTVEQVDGEAKLGQPMVNFNYFSDFGMFSIYAMPYFRERTFQGENGRLRPPIAIGEALYESDDEERNMDVAIRWQSSIDDWEVGVSVFSGTTREPELVTVPSEDGEPEILPFYAQIDQVGVDLLKVSGAWLLKLESIYRSGQTENFAALVTGFEYTKQGVFGSRYGLGFLAEYQFDEREDNFFAVGQNDLMAGLRVMVNDIAETEMLFGFVQDLEEKGTYSAFVEASSRLTSNWSWKLNGYFFSSDDIEDPYYFLRRDDHVQFSLEYYF
ncbi:hypothetical protein CW735_13910 [Alteromonas sp. MB-3u-76]|uniref:hypothetical protein n=1 Tax=Alteromonas sp. MB-3u-76 TaxID=2058133 RepID=UPI000C30A4E8|nr:hypothetical protein [Alteromonas sp. MB-3u-76]AUC89138.1 hypothetical protein CW735_13910 [Alteromonas sp. MB-3u-76]